MYRRNLNFSLTAAAVIALVPLANADPPGPRAPAPAAGSLFLVPERITFEDGGRVDAERGNFYVPVDRGHPERGTITVEVYRFAAGSKAEPGTPPVFLLHGGPGWPGLEGALESSSYYESLLGPLAEVADLVVVGQRGIGSSRPDTACEGTPEVAPDAVVTEDDRFAATREASEKCKSFWEAQGLYLPGFNVVEAAGDVADLRAALGYDKITLWGGSFGSHWSMAVLRYHPEIVARAVLTGLEGPDHTYDMPGDVLAALERIATEAEADPGLQAHLPEGGLLAAFRDVVAKVEKEPLLVEVGDPESGETRKVRFDADDVRGMAMGSTGSARSRRGLPRWPREILELHAGDFDRAAGERLEDGGFGYPTASFFMLDCGSGISRSRLERLLNDPAVAVVGPLGWFYRAACPVWGSDLGEAFRQNFETEIPAVLVHGNWDLSTPLENALELAAYFKNGKFVRVDRGTHGALREVLAESESFRDALWRFVATGDASALPDEVKLPPIAWEVPEPAAAAEDPAEDSNLGAQADLAVGEEQSSSSY